MKFTWLNFTFIYWFCFILFVTVLPNLWWVSCCNYCLRKICHWSWPTRSGTPQTLSLINFLSVESGVMKRAVKWTSTRRPPTGWKSAVWSTSTIEKGRLSTSRKRQAGRRRPDEKGRLKKAGRRRPVEKGRLVNIDHCLFLRRRQAALFITPVESSILLVSESSKIKTLC